jgi:hypothetical protein
MVIGKEEIINKAKELSSALYPTIGEFIVAFEALCHELKMGIGIILGDNGLRNESKLTDILVGDLTLSPSLNIYRGLLFETQKLNAAEVKIIDIISKKIIDLGQERNGIIHSAWFIDYKSSDDIDKGLLTQYRPGASKRGAKESPSKIPINNIKEFTKQARALGDLVEEINMCIYQGTKIENRFLIDKNGDLITQGSYMDSIEKYTGQGCPPCVPIPHK